MNELDIYSEDAITWTSRNDCVIDCAESWRQLEQRRRLCEIVSAKGTPEGETLRELRKLQDVLRGVFSDEGWKQSGIMLRYPFGG